MAKRIEKSIENLPGRIKVKEADAFLRRIEELGDINHYLFKVRNKDKVIETSKGVKPLTPEGRAILEISPESYRTRIKKNIGNVGCYAFPDGLCFLDFDLDIENPGNSVVPFEKIYELVETFNTFTVRTRSGGYQMYFKNPGLTDNPHIYYVPSKHQEGEPLIDAGELRCNNQYVVAPGSFVPKEGKKGFTDDANGVYQVIWDMPIQILDLKLFPDWLKTSDPIKDSLQKKAKEYHVTLNIDTTRQIQPAEDTTILNSRGVSLAKIRRNDDVLDDLLMGEEHLNRFHSPSEADFSAISKLLRKNFTPQQVYDIMMTHRPRLMKQKDEGYITRSIENALKGMAKSREENLSKGCTDLPVKTVNELPKSLPDHTITVIHGLPRIGKTDRMIDWLITEGTGTYVSATHSVILNAATIMKKKWDLQNITNQTAVIVVGKSYACNNDGKEKCNCRNCTKFPGKNSISAGLSFIDYKMAGNQLLTELKMLTLDNIPVDYCPYYILQLAKTKADFKFTVPFFTTVDNPFLKVEPGALTVIDEDPTIDYYRPKPLLIATYYSYIRDGGGVVIPHLGKSTIPDLKRLKKYIESKPKKLSDVDQVIVEIIQKFLQIHEALTVFNKSPTKSTKEWFDDDLKNINFTNNLSHESKLDVLKTVVKHISADGIKSADLPAVFEPALFPYEKTFSWQGTSPQSLFFIADNSLFKIPDFNRLVLVGGIRAELFAQDLAKKKEIKDLTHIRVSEFPFIQNYIVIRLNGPSEERIKQLKEANPDIKIDIPKAQRNQLQTLLQKTAGRNRKRSSRFPALIVTSSERKQEDLAKRLGECSARCKDHGIKSLWGFYVIGALVIFYENSIISRGLDIPFFDQLFLDSGSFATPYWTARKQHFKKLIAGLKDKIEMTEKTPGDPDILKENYKEEIEKINDIISTIQCDETTNCVLRAAPIHQNSSTERLKVIIIRDTDFYSKLDVHFSSKVTSISITDDDDSDALLDALEDVSHATTPTDENLDREKPTRAGSEIILHPQVVHTLIDLHDRLLNFTLPSPWRIEKIDRDILPYGRFIHTLKYIPSLRRKGKRSGHGGTISRVALIRRCRKRFNEQITDKTIKECIQCALADRILLEKRDGGNVSYYFHNNVLATLTNEPNTGPAYPVSLAILGEGNAE